MPEMTILTSPVPHHAGLGDGVDEVVVLWVGLDIGVIPSGNAVLLDSVVDDLVRDGSRDHHGTGADIRMVEGIQCDEVISTSPNTSPNRASRRSWIE